MKHIGITVGRAQVQTTVLLGTARILRKATGCGSISTVFSSIVLVCVSLIIIIKTKMQTIVCVGVSLTITILHFCYKWLVLLIVIFIINLENGTSPTLLHTCIHHLLQLHCLCLDNSRQCMDFVWVFVQDHVALSPSNNKYLSSLNESSHSLYVLKVTSFPLLWMLSWH